MSKNIIAKFRKSKKAQVIFCIVALIFSLTIFLWQSNVNIFSLIPSKKRLTIANEKLSEAQNEAKKVDTQMAELKKVEKEYKEIFSAAWESSNHGDPNVEMRKKIEDAAKKAGLNLSTVGSIKNLRINNDLSFLEIDFSAVETLEVLVEFFEQIEQLKPEFYWKRADFRHENLQNSERIRFTGTLRVIGRGGA